MTTPSSFKLADDNPIYEADAVDKYPFLSVSTLRSARKARQISWIKGKQSRAYYRPSAIEAFITNHLELPCHAQGQTHVLNSVDNGSRESPALQTSTDFGLTPDQIEHAAQALARKI